MTIKTLPKIIPDMDYDGPIVVKKWVLDDSRLEVRTHKDFFGYKDLIAFFEGRDFTFIEVKSGVSLDALVLSVNFEDCFFDEEGCVISLSIISIEMA